MTEKNLINASQNESGKTEFQSGSKKGKKKKVLSDKNKTENKTVNKAENEEAKTSFQGQSKEVKGKKKSHFKKEKMSYINENEAGETRRKGHSKKRKKESLFDNEAGEGELTNQHIGQQRKVIGEQLTENSKKVKHKKVGKRESKNSDDSKRAADIKKALEMKAKIEEEKQRQNQTQGETESVPLESSSKETPKESKKKKKKQKISEIGAVSMPGYDPPAGIVHEAIANSSHKRALQDDNEAENEEIKPAKKKRKTEEELDTPQNTRRRFKPCHSKEEDNRTIFVGNLSLDVSEKELMKIFREFGEIESLRRRCIPVKNPDQIKRASFIKKEFHPERHNSICYIKFKTVEAAKKALVTNGKVINDLHIRVDIASSDSQDTEKTVFVANLPFDVEEEPLRSHFEDCGNIENVRIVRDRKTCLGKGIGYIKFTEKSSIYFALKLNGSTFQKRSLRVQRCNYDQPSDGKKRKSHDQPLPGQKQKAGKFKQIPYDYDSDSSEEPVRMNKPKGIKNKPSEFFDEEEPVKVKKPKGTKNGQSAFIGEKAKRLKKLKKKSNFKSNMSVFFSTNNAPTRKRKSFDKITNDNSERGSNQENSVKHIRFGENDRSEKFKKTAWKKRDNKTPNDFENHTGKPFLKEKPGKKFHKKFDDHAKDGEKQHKNTGKFSKKVSSDSSKGKHIHFG